MRHLGIDFGTTNTVVSFKDANGKLKQINGGSVRSAVCFLSKHEYVIGDDAIRKAGINKQSLVLNFKPNISGEPIYVTAINGDEFKIKPHIVARLFLDKIRSNYIEKRFQKIFGNAELTEEDRVVITVPIKFSAEEKKLVKKAAINAHYPNVKLAFEPTAAAMAMTKNDEERNIIAVYDFGGGTFDISVIESDNGGKYVPLERDGDKKLGGNNITLKIAKDIIIPILNKQAIYIPLEEDEFDEDECGISEIDYKINIYEIITVAESIKTTFSEFDSPETMEFVVPIKIDEETFQIDFEVTKKEFEECIQPLIEETVNITRKVIDSVVNTHKVKIPQITMAGGSSKIYLAQKLLEDEFKSDGINIAVDEDVMSVISKGALEISEKENLIQVSERTASQFGVAERKGIGILVFESLIDINSALPVSGSKEYGISNSMLDCGELEIKCYEKDVRNYPNSTNVTEKGIEFINSYRISFDKNLKPETVVVTFSIEKDGTLEISALFKDKYGKVLENVTNSIIGDNDLE